jgi:hypothetical protein
VDNQLSSSLIDHQSKPWIIIPLIKNKGDNVCHIRNGAFCGSLKCGNSVQNVSEGNVKRVTSWMQKWQQFAAWLQTVISLWITFGKYYPGTFTWYKSYPLYTCNINYVMGYLRHVFMFGNKASFYGEQLAALCPTPRLEDRPLSAVRNYLFNIFAATFRIGGRSSIHNLRARHWVWYPCETVRLIKMCLIELCSSPGRQTSVWHVFC